MYTVNQDIDDIKHDYELVNKSFMRNDESRKITSD